jgi:hypothetical protein
MRDDGILKAIAGVTTIDEVVRLTRGEDIREIALERELESRKNE